MAKKAKLLLELLLNKQLTSRKLQRRFREELPALAEELLMPVAQFRVDETVQIERERE